MDIKPRVEALLYATETPISISDMAIMLSSNKDQIVKALKKLTREYNSNNSALEIMRNGFRYKLQLRKEYVQDVQSVSEREFSSVELQALGYIAANSDVKKGDMKLAVGSKYPDCVESLKRKGMIYSRKYRNTEIYNVTKKFYEYFDISKGKLSTLVKGRVDGHENVG